MFSDSKAYFVSVEDRIRAVVKESLPTWSEAPDSLAEVLVTGAENAGVPAARILRKVPAAFAYVGGRVRETIDIVSLGAIESPEGAVQYGDETLRQAVAITFNYGGPAEPIGPVLTITEVGSVKEGIKTWWQESGRGIFLESAIDAYKSWEIRNEETARKKRETHR